MNSSLYHRATAVLSESATELYDAVVFNNPSRLYNQPAPEPLVSFVVGGVLSVLTALYWYRYRWTRVSNSIQDQQETNSLTIRTMISTLADNDEPLFTILRVSSQSMLFLGGFQYDYRLTFSIMLGKCSMYVCAYKCACVCVCQNEHSRREHLLAEETLSCTSSSNLKTRHSFFSLFSSSK